MSDVPESVKSGVVREERAAFGGTQYVYEHTSEVLGCQMQVGVYVPPQGPDCPVLLFLSGLTCSPQNVISKAGIQRLCAEYGLVLVAPDTSPRGEHVADDEAWDLGQGAGFYLTATQEPWAQHYKMDQYVLDELPHLVTGVLGPADRPWGVTGHSMGGHGALVLALRNPGRFASVSALSPILQPSDVPWGETAFSAYLGEDRNEWAAWDASRLLATTTERLPILIDQGTADSFLDEQLTSEAFLSAAKEHGHIVTYRLQPGYDHSFYFVATFLGDHVDHHATVLHAAAGLRD
ncbi:MAG: S-formylglutathione hydrolase [Myxococcota bacterium]|jgi:S-formylglutathione hydrolase